MMETQSGSNGPTVGGGGREWNIKVSIGLSGSHFYQDCPGMAIITNSS